MMGGTGAAGMMGPSWLAGAFAAVMIATAVYCAGRIVAARWWRRPTGYDVDAVHVLMGTAMAGMLVPGLAFGPAIGWELVFGASAGWFSWRALASWRDRAAGGRSSGGHRPAQHGQHLLACLAMLYMLLATGSTTAAAAAGHPGIGVGLAAGAGAHLRALSLVLALALLSYVIKTADRLTALPLAGTGAAARRSPPPGALTVTAAAAPGPVPAGAPSGTGTTGRTPALSPRLAACCDIAMGVSMGYLLVLMISS